MRKQELYYKFIDYSSRRRNSRRARQVDCHIRSLHLRDHASRSDKSGLLRQIDGRLHWYVARPTDRSSLAGLATLFALLEGLRGRRFSCQRNDVLSSDDDQAQCALDLLLHSGLVSLGDSVLLGIGEHDVHVFVEGKEGADHHASILDGDPDPEVNPLQEFAPLRGHC